MSRLKKIAVIGPGSALCTPSLYKFGEALGTSLAKTPAVIVCGGLGGWMEAVCKGVKQSPFSFKGQTVGILPDEEPTIANPYIDIAVPTGLGIARNLIIIHAADLVIAAGGGAGTLSELAFAWQKGKKVICYDKEPGWAKSLAGKKLDTRPFEPFLKAGSIESIMQLIDIYLFNKNG